MTEQSCSFIEAVLGTLNDFKRPTSFEELAEKMCIRYCNIAIDEVEEATRTCLTFGIQWHIVEEMQNDVYCIVGDLESFLKEMDNEDDEDLVYEC